MMKKNAGDGIVYADEIGRVSIDVEDKQNLEERQFARLKKYSMELACEEKVLQQKLVSNRYQVCGKWEFSDDECNIVFKYDGKIRKIPFIAEFNEKNLFWLVEAAVMKIESYIESYLFGLKMEQFGGECWNE